MDEHDTLLLAPADEDSVLFQMCFYYGLLVVFVEVVVPLLFKRRLRFVLPNMLVLALAPRPLGDAAFAQQKKQLGAQIRELQRATSAAKLQRRKSVDALPLVGTKATPIERPASALRSSARASRSSTGGKQRRSATKRTAGTPSTATIASTASRSKAKTTRRRLDRSGADDHSAVYTQVSAASTALQPSRLIPPSRSYSAASHSNARSTERRRTVGDASAVDAATKELLSTSLSRHTSSRHTSRQARDDDHEPLEQRPNPDTSARSDTSSESEAQRAQHHRLQLQRDEEEAAWQHVQARDDLHDAAIAPAPVASAGPDQRALLTDRDDNERPAFALRYETQQLRARYASDDDDDEEHKTNETFVPTQRSIGSFAPTHRSRYDANDDDSDEAFLSQIRRPHSPVAMTRARTTFAGVRDEHLDVERTITAAFRGRPVGRNAVVHHYMQPMAAAPAASVQPLPPAATASHYQQTNMYEQRQQQHASYTQQHQSTQTLQQQQQRQQFITGRRASPGMRAPVGNTPNYRDVPRDRTPRIVRRIAFDEEMMALAATPDARSRSNFAYNSNSDGYDDDRDDSAAGDKRKRSVVFSPEDEAPDFSRRRTRF